MNAAAKLCGTTTIEHGKNIITRAQYAAGLCVCVRLCTYMCVCVSSKNTPVCVLPLETLPANTLCSFFTEFIVL